MLYGWVTLVCWSVITSIKVSEYIRKWTPPTYVGQGSVILSYVSSDRHKYLPYMWARNYGHANVWVSVNMPEQKSVIVCKVSKSIPVTYMWASVSIRQVRDTSGCHVSEQGSVAVVRPGLHLVPHLLHRCYFAQVREADDELWSWTILPVSAFRVQGKKVKHKILPSGLPPMAQVLFWSREIGR